MVEKLLGLAIVIAGVAIIPILDNLWIVGVVLALTGFMIFVYSAIQSVNKISKTVSLSPYKGTKKLTIYFKNRKYFRSLKKYDKLLLEQHEKAILNSARNNSSYNSVPKVRLAKNTFETMELKQTVKTTKKDEKPKLI